MEVLMETNRATHRDEHVRGMVPRAAPSSGPHPQAHVQVAYGAGRGVGNMPTRGAETPRPEPSNSARENHYACSTEFSYHLCA